MNLRVRLAIEWVAICLLATAIVTAIAFWRGTEAFDNLLYDQISAANRSPADSDILLVTIDDTSLAAIGKWPWNRSVHAQMMENLQAARPRSILLDVLLSEAGNVDGDAALAKAMEGKNPVILPIHFVTPGSDGHAYDTTLPAAPFATAAHAMGHVNVAFDSDGIVRRAALCFQAEPHDTQWPHVAELAYRESSKAPSAAYKRQSDACGSEYLIPYTQRGAFAEISYSDILAGNVPAKLIEGRDIIVGATATGMGDSFPTPNADGGLLPGIEIIANMLGAVRHNNFIMPLGMTPYLLLSIAPLWILMLAFIFLRPQIALAVSLVSIAAILVLSALMLSTQLWFPPGAALLGLLVVYPLWGWRRLQAMSDFMTAELAHFNDDEIAAALPVAPKAATDLVGRQSEALTRAITKMRGLGRFISNTLSDLPDPMFVTDPTGKITLINDALDARNDRPIVGLNMIEALRDLVTPEHRKTVVEYIQGQRSQGDFVRFETIRGKTLVMRRSDIRDETNQLHGHIHYLTDITDLAKAEEQREEVLQLLSHDMRAPQSAIIAALDGPIDEAARRRIERNARRTMQLAQDFVDIARMGEAEFAGEDVLLADLVNEAADGLWPLAKERNITVNVVDKSDAPFVLAEPDSLSRAFSNLIDNAIKFSPDGASVEINIERSEERLSVTVRDHGAGISPDLLPRLFSRFVSVDEQGGRVKGAGLGLVYVEAVMTRHQGTISAGNAPDGGAYFVATLPEAPEPSA